MRTWKQIRTLASARCQAHYKLDRPAEAPSTWKEKLPADMAEEFITTNKATYLNFQLEDQRLFKFIEEFCKIAGISSEEFEENGFRLFGPPGQGEAFAKRKLAHLICASMIDENEWEKRDGKWQEREAKEDTKEAKDTKEDTKAKPKKTTKAKPKKTKAKDTKKD